MSRSFGGAFPARDSNSPSGNPLKASPYHSQLVNGTRGMVAAENLYCSDIGADILRVGGSAVDAAIASTLCIGVVHSFSSGIGGGGFLLVRNGTNQSELIDFREVAPARATSTMYEKNITLAQVGGLAVAVPGEIRGFEAAHRKYGKLSWAELFQPSIQLARDGFVVDKMLAKALKFAEDLVLRDPGFRESFTVPLTRTAEHRSTLPPVRVAQEGDIIRRTRLAATLERIASEGPDVFYLGDMATHMAETAQARGGIVTRQDFADYRAILRPSLHSEYRGYHVHTAPPPTSGSILAMILNTLEGFPLEEDCASYRWVNYHRFVESLKFAYAQRTVLADPAFIPLDKHTIKMLDKGFAAQVRANISDTRTFPVPYYNPTYDVDDPHGTTHLSVLDHHGQAVALTSTVNLVFGAQVMDPETGIILNCEMDDFSTQNKTNAFGYSPSPNNRIKPGKRPLSSAVPVILERDGQVRLVAGASGGSRIISSVAQVLMNAMDFRMPLNEAVDFSRLHEQLMPDEIRIEEGFEEEFQKYLENKGHNLTLVHFYESAVQVVSRSSDGVYYGAADDRKKGLAAAV
ncbi:hypothetical protein IWQ62_001279 [Dispira parvispora]|uniref:Glutathione hydrolase n=1 Tax=Dispira parvispora TaxID=1520584 RepID=A0A9W8AZE5_9FUNG|nr:hypothetical protein IWQ62_001279 [Dispira parvispora]